LRFFLVFPLVSSVAVAENLKHQQPTDYDTIAKFKLYINPK